MQEENQKEFYIIMGRSGCGKGTQAELLKKYLEEQGAEKVLHVTTGGGFRKLIEGETYAAKVARTLTESGGLAPEFLAIWVWSSVFIENISGVETVILDGAPRRTDEVIPLKGAISFFGYGKPIVIYVDVSEAWAVDKLISRGRTDDNAPSEQEKKMKWFNEDVVPCIEEFKKENSSQFIQVNGEQTIEEVHKEIIRKLDEVRH
jgi:adenylate kinase family enzyme